MATSDFMTSVLADALNGTRPVSWDTTDTMNLHAWIASRDGDAFRVRVTTDAGGEPVLTYYDTSDQPAGTLGIAPAIAVVVGIGIIAGAAVTIGAIVLAC